MGIGMVVIVPEEESETTVNIIEKYNQVYKIGKVSGNPGQVALKTFENDIINL